MVFAAALAVAAGAVAAVLVRQLRSRPDVPIRFAAIALGAAAVHALLFAVVFRRWAMRGAAIYVAASALLFAAAGGARHAAGLVVLVASALLLGAAGRRIGALFLPDHSLTTGVSLGVGIAAASLVVSLALLFGVFGTPFLAGFALAAVALAVPELRRRKAGTSAIVSDIGAGAQLTGAVVIELTFLFGAAAIVRGIAPESGFDALTRYLPWLKIAARTGAFPDIPWQFPFIIPQSGVAFSLLYTFDPVAQRVAMLLALAVCAAIAGARRLRKDVAPGLAGLVALVVASCPLVLVAAHGVQPDAFSWLAVLLLGVAAGDGDPHRAA
ncbi:MAG TPA: hypothetical protein VFL12_04990, partial [Thermoanaerobaculia bacterium]|nr:hypothetical protein [Thermoanaerobaculia bacterium]